MSRRNQSRRRRNYGRRQHELRERPPQATDLGRDERAGHDQHASPYLRSAGHDGEELRP